MNPPLPVRAALRYSLVVFLVLRVALGLLAVLGTALIPPQMESEVVASPGWHNLVGAWERWDATWFLRIARDGYEAHEGSAAFFPAYPMLIRAGGALVGGHHLGVALLLSNLFAIAALAAVYLVTFQEFGTPVARRATLYLAIFPTAFFLLAPYSESLFLFLVATCFLAARRGRWGWAALAGAGATATRSIGLALVPALAVEAVLQWRASEDRSVTRLLGRLGCSAGATAGALAYLGSWQLRTGDALAPVRSQGGWLREPTSPLSAIWEAGSAALSFAGRYPGGYHQVDFVLFVVGALCVAWVVARARLTYGVYALLSLVLPLTFVFPGRPLMSVPRFLVVIFPIAWALARFAERHRAHTAVVAVSAGGLGLLTVLFVGWYFVF